MASRDFRKRASQTQPDGILQPAEASDSPSSSYTEDDVRRRAYERYQERNGSAGDPETDWYAAEEELRVQQH